MRIGVTRQLVVVTADSDIREILRKVLHTFKNVECSDVLRVCGFCDAAATDAKLITRINTEYS
jgi:hypothetical protein